MPVKIHPTAVISPNAQVAADVTIGPFCIIESDVSIGGGCVLEGRVTIKSGSTLGENNRISDGAVIGGLPQHIHIPEHPGKVQIGSHNTFREFVTIHRALKTDAPTVVGDHNLIMVGGHVAHDCQLGNNIIFANNAMLGGHVWVDDRAYISGAVAVHQFCRIGSYAMIGGHARVVQDVPPYVTIDGLSGCVVGLNLIGLRRNGFTAEQIITLKNAYRLIYRTNLKWNEIVQRLQTEYAAEPAARLHRFFSAGTRGFVQERRMPPNATLKLRRQSDEDSHGSGGLHAKVG